jgi:diacylglycerol O-acyltransferase
MTLNDVAVAIVAGALRQYLLAHGELPRESVLGSMPVNMRTRVGETGDNNQVGAR